MEAEPEQNNFFEQTIYLNSNEELNSNKLKKSYLFSCTIEDNMFKITAMDDEDTYFLQFRLVDWIKRKEKDFVKLVNNYEAILQNIKKAIEKKRYVLYKLDAFALKMILYYTILFDEESISFELHKKSEDEEEEKELISKFYSESEPIIQENTRDYRAEKIDYSTNFEDEGDRTTIKLRLKIQVHVHGKEEEHHCNAFQNFPLCFVMNTFLKMMYSQMKKLMLIWNF